MQFPPAPRRGGGMGRRERLKISWEVSPVWVRVPPAAQVMAERVINKNFFQIWNSEMSYILGMIAADGSLGIKRIRKDGSKQYFLEITSKDLRLLRKIKKVMGASQKIGIKHRGSDKKIKYYRIQIGHQTICRDLLKLGLKPRKTYSQFTISVPQQYFPDFVRGFFDGDGSVYIYKVNNTPQIKANFRSSSFLFMKKFAHQLCKSLNVSRKAIHKEIFRKGKIPMYSIYFYVDDCEKLAKFMYGNNPTLYLPRKRRIFERWNSIKRRHYVKKC